MEALRMCPDESSAVRQPKAGRRAGAMVVKINASQAAQLVARSEKWIRAAIRRGDLPAEEDTAQGGRVARDATDAGGRRVGPSRWAIDVDDLIKLPGARVNRVMLAELA